MLKNDAGEVWGVWAEPTAANSSNAVAQWCFVNLTRDEAEAQAARKRKLWREHGKAIWTHEARLMYPAPSALGMLPIEGLARALHAEATQDVLRSIINDCPPGHRMQTQEQRVCGIAWSRLKLAEREAYLARAVGLLSFIEGLKK